MRKVAVVYIDQGLTFAFTLAFTFSFESVVVVVAAAVVVIVVVVVVVVVVVTFPFTFGVGGVRFVFVPFYHFVNASFNFCFYGFVVVCFTVPVDGCWLALAYKMPVPVNVVPWVMVRKVGL